MCMLDVLNVNSFVMFKYDLSQVIVFIYLSHFILDTSYEKSSIYLNRKNTKADLLRAITS